MASDDNDNLSNSEPVISVQPQEQYIVKNVTVNSSFVDRNNIKQMAWLQII